MIKKSVNAKVPYQHEEDDDTQEYVKPKKQLSDEEINALYLKHGNTDWDWQIKFARAIIKEMNK